MKLTPFELAEQRAISLFGNLAEMSAIQKLLIMSDNCKTAFGDMKLSRDVRANAVADARAINNIFQTMGNTREKAGISC
jgi:hypothetical protein